MRNRIMKTAALLALAASAALADQVTINLDTCNTAICALNLGSPFGTVTKTLVDDSGNPVLSGTGNILVQLVLFDGLVLIQKGLAFNSSVTLGAGSVTGVAPGANYGPLNTAGTHMDGFTQGQDSYKFQYSIPGPNGLSDPNASSTLSFLVLGSFSTVEVLDQPNGKGYDWAADVGLPNCASGSCTGFIAHDITYVPEPGTATLFGAGLIGMGVMLRRRRASRRSA